MAETSEPPPLPPLSDERILQIKNFLKPKGLRLDELSTEPNTTNGLYQIIYNFIVKYYPTFPNALDNNPDNQLQTFITAMNNIHELSIQSLNLIDQPERTQTQSYISDFSGFGEGNNALNNILFTYKEHFGNISIWNEAPANFVDYVRKEPFGPQIDTLNYFFPELNILFLDNRITLLITTHDKFSRDDAITFLSSPASSLQDFMVMFIIGGPLGNHDGYHGDVVDAAELDDDGGDDGGGGDGDENPEPTEAPPPPPQTTSAGAVRADLVAARENNNRLIQPAMDRITQLQTEIRNMRSQPLPRGPPAVARGNRERRIRLRRDQIARNRAIIRRYEELNSQIDGSLQILHWGMELEDGTPGVLPRPQADELESAEAPQPMIPLEEDERENNNRLILSARDRIALYHGLPFQQFDHHVDPELATIYIPEPDTNNSIRGQIINEESIIRDGEELNRLLDRSLYPSGSFPLRIPQLRLQLDAAVQVRTIVEAQVREAEQAAAQAGTRRQRPIRETLITDLNELDEEFAALEAEAEAEEEEEAAAAEAEAEAEAAPAAEEEAELGSPVDESGVLTAPPSPSANSSGNESVESRLFDRPEDPYDY